MENKADKGYSRQLDLEEKFNCYWNQTLKTNGVNYLKRFTTNDLVEMKKAISNINNLITLKVTLAFIDEICRLGIIDLEQAGKIREEVDRQHPNTNGFDVCCEKEKEGIDFIAEVKCNIPVGGDEFGAAQMNGIIKDLEGMMGEKKNHEKYQTSDCHKFMVLLEMQDGNKVKDAMQNLLKNNKEYKDVCVELENKNIDTKHIYILSRPTGGSDSINATKPTTKPPVTGGFFIMYANRYGLVSCGSLVRYLSAICPLYVRF